MSDGPYTRIYHQLSDEYPAVYDSPDLAAYVRLLIAADQAWPSKARWKGYAEDDELARLVDAGLIDVDGARFTVKGLEKERKRRRASARKGAQKRWSDPDADAHALADVTQRANAMQTHMQTHSERNANGMPSRAEPSRAEPSRAKTSQTARDRSRGLTPLRDVLGGRA